MSTLRISGFSGLDTEQMIKDLMKAENMKVDRVKQDKQYVEWQQEAYREIIGDIRDFQSTFFDVLKPSTNISATSSFAKFSYSVTSGGLESSALSVTATAAASKSLTIESIDRLATKDTWKGEASGLRGIETSGLNLTDLKASGKDLELSLAIGSDAKTINISSADLAGINTSAELTTALNTKIEAAFGSDYNAVASSTGTEVKFDFAGREVKILKSGDNQETLDAFGVASGASSYGYETQAIGDLFDFTAAGIDVTALNINGQTIALSETDTLTQMNKKLNDAGAGFEISYSQLSDSFTMVASQEGSVNNITLDDANTEAFVTELFGAGVTRTAGENAAMTIDGTQVIQSSNVFEMDGMTFDLKATSTTAIDVKVGVNTESVVDNIRSFVTEYNKLIDDISGKLKEKRDYDYKPLTDEQREALSEEEIENWEGRAKLGILKGASELDNMLTQLRNAVIEPIEGVGLSMNDIGISSASYQDRGKLSIDEDKLNLALENNYDDVVALFTAKSDVAYTESANRSERFKESGIGDRFGDILKDYVRTTRDSNGNKGILLVKAGVENDTSVLQNDLSKRIAGYDTRIDSLMDYLTSREDYYYTMFTRMESALSQLESQSASLSGMFSGGA